MSQTILARTHRASALWERASGEIESDWVTRWCQRSKDELLAAADGDPTQFVERVQATLDTWDARVKEAMPC